MPNASNDDSVDSNRDDAFLGRHVANLGALVVELTFRVEIASDIYDPRRRRVAVVGYRETVDTTMVEIRTNVFFASWKERSGATVTNCEDSRVACCSRTQRSRMGPL